MAVEEATQTSFPELAKNIRANIERAKAVAGTALDTKLLSELLNVLEQKIGGRRPELPPVSAKPDHSDYERLWRTRRRLKRRIQAAKEALTSGNEQRRNTAKNHLRELRAQFAQTNTLARSTSFREYEAQRATYSSRLAEYEKQRLAIDQWNARHGRNADYDLFRKIADRLRADAESYMRGDFAIQYIKLPWRFLPSGHIDASWIADEMQRLKRRYPHLRFQAERLDYARRLGPSEVYRGEAEFDGYFAYVFRNTRHVLLENPQEGNAAYIFKRDWKPLSKRTKQALLSSYRYCIDRVFHREDTNWKLRIRRSLQL